MDGGKRLGQRDNEGVTVPLHARRPRWPTHTPSDVRRPPCEFGEGGGNGGARGWQEWSRGSAVCFRGVFPSNIRAAQRQPRPSKPTTGSIAFIPFSTPKPYPIKTSLHTRVCTVGLVCACVFFINRETRASTHHSSHDRTQGTGSVRPGHCFCAILRGKKCWPTQESHRAWYLIWYHFLLVGNAVKDR